MADNVILKYNNQVVGALLGDSNINATSLSPNKLEYDLLWSGSAYAGDVITTTKYAFDYDLYVCYCGRGGAFMCCREGYTIYGSGVDAFDITSNHVTKNAWTNVKLGIIRNTLTIRIQACANTYVIEGSTNSSIDTFGNNHISKLYGIVPVSSYVSRN